MTNSTATTSHKPGLVLARRQGEVAVIETPSGEKIVISVVLVDRNQVKLGINCPREWNVYRGEIRGEYLESKYRPDR